MLEVIGMGILGIWLVLIFAIFAWMAHKEGCMIVDDLKDCQNCYYANIPGNKEPCKSCDMDNHSKWEFDE